MTIFGVWHGGANYGVGDLNESVEIFDSLRAARAALSDRERLRAHWLHTFTYADGRVERVETPCVENSSMTIWFADPRNNPDPYPDRLLTVGPRGGIRMEAC